MKGKNINTFLVTTAFTAHANVYFAMYMFRPSVRGNYGQLL